MRDDSEVPEDGLEGFESETTPTVAPTSAAETASPLPRSTPTAADVPHPVEVPQVAAAPAPSVPNTPAITAAHDARVPPRVAPARLFVQWKQRERWGLPV